MKRLAIPTTLVPALMPNAMDTALMFVMTTNRKYVKNLDALSWNPVNTKVRNKLSTLRSSDAQFNLHVHRRVTHYTEDLPTMK